jgi:hypothetical protein
MSDEDDNDRLLFKLAGFALAHAAWCVRDGETLCTMALTETDNDRQLLRFDVDSMPDSLEIGRQHLSEIQTKLQRWVLVYDGYITLNEKRRDALVIQPWSRSHNTVARIVQPYQHKKLFQKFQVLGAPIVIDMDNAILNALDAAAYQFWIQEGVDEHPKAAEFWGKGSQVV